MELDIEKHIQAIKDAGEWTTCHEYGHEITSADDLICMECGQDFNSLVAILEGKNTNET